jgi:ABC-type phosphate transport system substrate-binding protein
MRVLLYLLVTVFLGPGCTESNPPPALDAPQPAREGTLRIAGESAGTPLIRNLARTFSARMPGPALVVEAPLQSEGAQRALRAGALAAAIVMTPGTRPPSANARAIARTQPILVAGPGVRARILSPRDLLETLQGHRPTWIDGLARQVILRPADDPLQLAFTARMPMLREAFAEAVASGRWRVLSSDGEVRGTLRQTPGAIGVVDTGNLNLHGAPLWPLRFPSALPLTIWLVPGEKPSPRMQAFLAFLSAPGGRSLVADLGFGLPEVRR